MDEKKLETAISEAKRFLSLAKDYAKAVSDEKDRVRKARAATPQDKWQHYHQSFPVLSGSVRRASMDLTRSLANLRKPGA